MKTYLFFGLVALLAAGCIGDDIVQDAVEPELRITNPLDSLAVGATHQYEVQYFNGIGQPELAEVTWSSSAPSIVSITADGLATGLQEGSALLRADVNAREGSFSATVLLEVGANTVAAGTFREGMIRSTSSYLLEGDFELHDVGAGRLELRIADNYRASTSLPGLYVYLTNNPNTSVGALEIGRVVDFNGAHTYVIEGSSLNDYSHVLYFCKPFNVKVGDGEILD
ncbi:MAG: hypothetical protein GC205_04040 [Bacteroidetes bacterium]|nr:hypothetical protein [Bacteroidota bacterium]